MRRKVESGEGVESWGACVVGEDRDGICARSLAWKGRSGIPLARD